MSNTIGIICGVHMNGLVWQKGGGRDPAVYLIRLNHASERQ